MKVVSLENLSKYNELLSQKTVRSVNSVKPDSNGNIQLGTEKSTFNKVEYDTGYFSISTAKTYNFDLTGSDLENVSKENVNIRLVAKVVTAHNGFEVGDIAQLSTGLDISPDWKELGVCAYIRGNTLYIYSGNYDGISIVTEPGKSFSKSKVQIKAVLTAFVPDDGSILLIAEDQTNTSKLIGLPDGTLTWSDKNLVRSVNGVNANENGNVEFHDYLPLAGGNVTGNLSVQNKNVVRSVNGVNADTEGNVSDIVESGPDYIRYANGVQICWGVLTKYTLLWANHQANWNLPKPFKDTNYTVQTTAKGVGGEDFLYVEVEPTDISYFHCSYIPLQTYSNGTIKAKWGDYPDPYYSLYLAIGYWK